MDRVREVRSARDYLQFYNDSAHNNVNSRVSYFADGKGRANGSSVGRSVCRSVGCSVRPLLGWSVRWLVGLFVFLSHTYGMRFCI